MEHAFNAAAAQKIFQLRQVLQPAGGNGYLIDQTARDEQRLAAISGKENGDFCPLFNQPPGQPGAGKTLSPRNQYPSTRELSHLLRFPLGFLLNMPAMAGLHNQKAGFPNYVTSLSRPMATAP